MWKQPLFGGLALVSTLCLLSTVPFTDLHRLLGVVREGVRSKEPSGDSLWVKDFECANGYGRGVNQEYTYQGTTMDGRPYYRGVTEQDRYIYYDAACAPDTPGGRWFLGQQPDISLAYDLNRHDGSGCNNDFSILTDAKTVPEGKLALDWQWCGDHGHHGSKSIYIAHASSPTKNNPDCYFDPECSKRVDWGSVKVTKERLFARISRGSITKSELPFLRRAVRESLLKAGIPGDRVDYIVDKWLKTPSDTCLKFFDENMRSGCHACQHGYPKRVTECLKCGGQCVKEAHCQGADDCGHNPKFMKCHDACMVKGKKGVCYNQPPGPMKAGCESCQHFYPGKVQKCMTCGGKCVRIAPCTGPEDCGKNPKFVQCHRSCMKANPCHEFYPGREAQCWACGKKCWKAKPCNGPCETDLTFVDCHMKCMK